MTGSNEKKPAKAPDFAGTPEIPAATRNWLAGVIRQSHDSVLWTVTPVAGNSIARGLAERSSFAVRIHAGQDFETRTPLVYPGTLACGAGTDGGVEYELRFDESPPEHFHPYALCVVPLDIWSFEPLSLGRLPATTVKRNEFENAPEHEWSAEGVGALAAAGADSETLAVANERLDLHWSDGQLEIRLARPPRRRGQPVVVETHVLDPWGELQTARKVVSAEDRITDGQFAGYGMASIICREPAHFDLDHLRITVRPLREDDLSWLNPDQVDPLLAGQKLTVLKTLAEGFPLRAAATWDDQKAATSDPRASWLLRVSTGKGVR